MTVSGPLEPVLDYGWTDARLLGGREFLWRRGSLAPTLSTMRVALDEAPAPGSFEIRDATDDQAPCWCLVVRAAAVRSRIWELAAAEEQVAAALGATPPFFRANKVTFTSQEGSSFTALTGIGRAYVHDALTPLVDGTSEGDLAITLWFEEGQPMTAALFPVTGGFPLVAPGKAVRR